jgi:hypothetical protein
LSKTKVRHFMGDMMFWLPKRRSIWRVGHSAAAPGVALKPAWPIGAHRSVARKKIASIAEELNRS